MSYDNVTATREEAPEDDSEATEVEGVATIDLLAPQEEAELGAAPDVALSANFSLSEFHCCRGHCAKEAVPANAVPALRRLVTQVLQPMRDRFGLCTVHSGYRNAAHNAHVGGADQSHHRYDVRPDAPAADVSFAGGSVNEWAVEARRLLGNIGGVGRYPSSGFVHVDLGAFRKWDG